MRGLQEHELGVGVLLASQPYSSHSRHVTENCIMTLLDPWLVHCCVTAPIQAVVAAQDGLVSHQMR